MNDIFILRASNCDKFAVIDAEDKNLVLAHNDRWYCVCGCGYFSCRSKITKNKIYLHRVVAKAEDGKEVHHNFGLKFDNRKSQISALTRSQHQATKTVFKASKTNTRGVTFNKALNKYQAQIGIHNSNKVLGYFDNITEAAIAYNKAAILEFGNFATLNQI